MIDMTWTLRIKLDPEGGLTMDDVQNLKDAVMEQSAVIVTEIEQLAQRGSVSAADLQALADKIRDNSRLIQAMVPDEAPPTP
jgi:hypothetical protein